MNEKTRFYFGLAGAYAACVVAGAAIGTGVGYAMQPGIDAVNLQSFRKTDREISGGYPKMVCGAGDNAKTYERAAVLAESPDGNNVRAMLINDVQKAARSCFPHG